MKGIFALFLLTTTENMAVSQNQEQNSFHLHFSRKTKWSGVECSSRNECQIRINVTECLKTTIQCISPKQNKTVCKSFEECGIDCSSSMMDFDDCEIINGKYTCSKLNGTAHNDGNECTWNKAKKFPNDQKISCVVDKKNVSCREAIEEHVIDDIHLILKASPQVFHNNQERQLNVATMSKPPPTLSPTTSSTSDVAYHSGFGFGFGFGMLIGILIGIGFCLFRTNCWNHFKECSSKCTRDQGRSSTAVI